MAILAAAAGGCASGGTGNGGGGTGTTSQTATTTTSATGSTTTTTSTSSDTGTGGSTGGTGGTGGTGPVAGDTCATAIALPGAGSYDYDSTAAHNDYDQYLGACSTSGKTAEGNDLVFAVQVAAGEILDVTLTPSATEDAVLLLTSACGDPVATCVDVGDAGFTGEPETLTYVNQTSAAQTMYLVADNFDPSSGGKLTLEVKLHKPVCGDGVVDAGEACDDGNTTNGDGCTACVVDAGYRCAGAPSTCALIPQGDTCATAIPVSASGTFTGNYDNCANDYEPQGPDCAGYVEAGPDVVYAVTLGAGQELIATLTPGASQDVALYAVTDCADVTNSCVAGADSGSSGDPESFKYVATTAETLYLMVDAHSTTVSGAYSLDVQIKTPVCGDGVIDANEACDDGNTTASDGCTACAVDGAYRCSGEPSVCVEAPAGDLCGNAIAVTASGTFPGTYDGFTNDYDPGDLGCTDTSEPGNDIVYAVPLAAGQTVKAVLTPGAGQDVAVYLVTDCADVANACPMGADSGVDGDPETLTYTATAAGTVYLIVDSWDDLTAGAYSLAVTIQ
jgi:cysteine-rich repeat protein